MNTDDIIRTIEVIVYTTVLVFVFAVCSAGMWQQATVPKIHAITQHKQV